MWPSLELNMFSSLVLFSQEMFGDLSNEELVGRAVRERKAMRRRDIKGKLMETPHPRCTECSDSPRT